MSIEEWRPAPVAGYSVSSLGRVMSHKGKAPRELKPVADHKGYMRVRLSRGTDGDVLQISVHVLVALVFHGPRPDGEEVRHLDGDKLNCAAANLAYGTRSQNQLDAVGHGTHVNSAKTHCRNGHPYDEANTYVNLGRRRCRFCRVCNRAAVRRYKEQQKQRAANAAVTA